MRKIIQLVLVPNRPEQRRYLLLYALCDDGTLWWRNEGKPGAEWQLEEKIPQG